jgi:hypothetical protein
LEHQLRPIGRNSIGAIHINLYSHQTDSRGSGVATPFTLIKGDAYKPENAIGHAQQFLVTLYLVAPREWTDYWNIHNMEIPRPITPSYTVKVQGNPGAGKTFMICTTPNMTRNVMGAMDYDMVTVTTGIAADLICGETHIRGYSIPTQKKIVKKPPIDIHH